MRTHSTVLSKNKINVFITKLDDEVLLRDTVQIFPQCNREILKINQSMWLLFSKSLRKKINYSHGNVNKEMYFYKIQSKFLH